MSLFTVLYILYTEAQGMLELVICFTSEKLYLRTGVSLFNLFKYKVKVPFNIHLKCKFLKFC